MRHMDSSRTLSLSDGVFAIVLTLLVLTLQLPDGPGDHLSAELHAALPRLEAWLISFIATGSLWVIHHHVFGLVDRVDTRYCYCNLLLLMCISIVPWTSALVGAYKDPLAVVIFSATLGLSGLIMTLQWVHASGPAGLTMHDVMPGARRRVILLLLRIPAAALLACGLAYVHRSLGIWTWLLTVLWGAMVRGEMYSREPAEWALQETRAARQQAAVPKMR